MTCLVSTTTRWAPDFASENHSFEKSYDPLALKDWMKANPAVPIVAVFLYGAGIFLGKIYFAKHDRWNWRNALAAWNLFLSVFSFIGVMRTAPALLHNLMNMSLRDNFCEDPSHSWGSGTTGLWVQLFVLSKIP